MLLWGVVAFAARPYEAETPPSMPIDIVSVSDFTQLTAGSQNAPKRDDAKPLAEKVGEKKSTDDPDAKVVDKKEITASTDAPPPMPEPKPVEKEKKAESKPKPDLIAEALKKDDTKTKTEQKKAAAKIPTPPKRPQQPQPKFDPKKVEALLDKRSPQRLATAGEVPYTHPALGSAASASAQLSQSEFDALRRRLTECWSPPVGAANAGHLQVVIRVLFKPDGTVARPPDVVAGSASQFGPAMAESAKRAVLRCQPYDMLKPEHYEQWKDIEINFDPIEMFRG